MLIQSFNEQLAKQIRFLEASCKEYDSGNRDEAVRIATCLRIMFHDTKNSKSLLTHLGSKKTTTMFSTSRVRGGLHPQSLHPGIMAIRIDVESVSVDGIPLFDSRPAGHMFVTLDEWWNNEAIYHNEGRFIFRGKLVLAAANKDGGAHVDEVLSPEYEWLMRGQDLRFSKTKGSEKTESQLVNVHFPCIRQIAHEVFRSPDVMKLAISDLPSATGPASVMRNDKVS